MIGQNGGNIRLHSRLFAQRLDCTFPRECFFPHNYGTIVTSGIDELNDYAVEEMMTIIVVSL